MFCRLPLVALINQWASQKQRAKMESFIVKSSIGRMNMAVFMATDERCISLVFKAENLVPRCCPFTRQPPHQNGRPHEPHHFEMPLKVQNRKNRSVFNTLYCFKRERSAPSRAGKVLKRSPRDYKTTRLRSAQHCIKREAENRSIQAKCFLIFGDDFQMIS